MLLACIAALPRWTAAQSLDRLESHAPSQTLLIGFVGGFVRSNDTRHPEVRIIQHFQQAPIPGIHAEIFRSKEEAPADKRILQLLDENGDGILSIDEKQRARIILFGHSWGGAAVIKLAQELDRQHIPVTLAIQIDSVGKFEHKSCAVPANVRSVVNFYQTKLPARGCQALRPVDPERTKILANIHLQYQHQPPECRELPWWDHWFMRSHNSVGCDPQVWSEVEKQIATAFEAISPLTPAPAE